MSERQAMVAGAELDRIARARPITADAVIEEARKRGSPLHGFFEWDDSRAAQEYRLDQARHLVRSITVTVEGNGEPIAVRAFVHVGSRQEYMPSVRAMRQSEIREEVVARALAELESWRRRYYNLREFAGVVAAIDSVTRGKRAETS